MHFVSRAPSTKLYLTSVFEIGNKNLITSLNKQENYPAKIKKQKKDCFMYYLHFIWIDWLVFPRQPTRQCMLGKTIQAMHAGDNHPGNACWGQPSIKYRSEKQREEFLSQISTELNTWVQIDTRHSSQILWYLKS